VADLEPVAYRELRRPREIKAFADPLRLRIIHILLERRATNQQVADALGEPPAKVFHHVRFLLNLGLIRLVDTRINGKNVEKFYRAVARSFIVRPDADLLPETQVAALGAGLDGLRRDVLESAAAWDDDPPRVLRRQAHLAPAQLEAFETRLRSLIQEYWVETEGQSSGASRAVLTILTYREPPDSRGESEERREGAPGA
jgi:DNA-binding transcriptional ArsR family regulator